ncbi:MAG: chromosome segregation protein SMC [Lachnospiraceae bacterium]|nr:chromosome segregation protein SMC [Lachnospiraceae bacterium]
MKIESLKIKNYRVFRDVQLENIPNFAVFLGKNGVGKTTFFDVFGFLHDCLVGNVNSALARRGGFNEVISRDQEGNIEFEIKFRPSEAEPLTTYELSIGLGEKNLPIVKREVLRLRRGQKGAPWKVLEFSGGEGYAAEGELNTYEDVQLAGRKMQKLESPDILAIKGLGQFKEFAAISSFRRLIEDWYVADLRVDVARERRESVYSERLSRTGDNLADVAKYIYDNYPEVFNEITKKMAERVPGVSDVEARITEDGYVVLRFQNGEFKNPFASKFVSDGTIKMFTYLVLLNDPSKHALLCVEEPENQLYPELLESLAEEFETYSSRDGQVFVSTHSPDFLNAVDIENIFVVKKEEGFSTIMKASDNKLALALYQEGDLPGALWKQNILTGEGL